jgi:ABC-type multidrug transport system ATPase subunit
MWFSESKHKPNKRLLYLQAFSKNYFYNKSDTSVTVQTFNTFARQDAIMNAVIEVKNLTKDFREIKAVDDLSFSVPAGQVYGFLGQNGAGKSTTIRMLLTLIKPTSGEIEIFGMDLQKHRKEILRQAGAIIERPDLYKYLTALENLRIFAAMSGIKISEKKLIDQLAKVGLADRANSKIKTYSQGMKQRLGIAIALVHDPKLIILDEPINGLDPQGIADVRNLILHLSNDLAKTIFISSHVLSEMELIADSMLIIDKGRKVAEGSKEKLLNPVKTQVELITDDNETSVRIIKETIWGNCLLENDNENILFEISKTQIPELNKTLVEKGVNIISLRPKHSLEDFFLSLMAH